MTTRWTTEIKEGEDGNYFIQFPDNFREITGWKEDDVLLYDVVDGAIIIKNLTQTNIGVV